MRVRFLRPCESRYVRLAGIADVDGIGRVPVIADMRRGRRLTCVEQEAENSEDEHDNECHRRPGWEVKAPDALPCAHAPAARAGISIGPRLPAAPEVHRRGRSGGRGRGRSLPTARTLAPRLGCLPAEAEPRAGYARRRALFR